MAKKTPRIRVSTYADLVCALHRYGATKARILKGLRAAEGELTKRNDETSRAELAKVRQAIEAASSLPDDPASTGAAGTP